MEEKKRRKTLGSNPKKSKRKLPKFDKPFNIGELLYTPLGQVCDFLIKNVEVPFPDPIEPKHEIIFQEYQSQLKIELLWVLKEWYRLWQRTEYPFNTVEARALESKGWCTFQLLNLAFKCKEFDPSFSHPLMHWLYAIAEDKISTLGNWFEAGVSRQASIQNNKTAHDLLAIWQNPYKSDIDPSKPIKYCTTRYFLFDSAIAIGKIQPEDTKEKRKEREQFRIQAWKPYLDAIQKMNRDQRDGVGDIDFASYQIRGDSIHLLQGGRKTEVVYSPPRKNISGRGRKSKQNLNNPYTVSDTGLLNQILTDL